MRQGSWFDRAPERKPCQSPAVESQEAYGPIITHPGIFRPESPHFYLNCLMEPYFQSLEREIHDRSGDCGIPADNHGPAS
jgi:hypothetical protein